MERKIYAMAKQGRAKTSFGKAVLGKVKAMNGQEWLWKSYEGKSFATEMPLKRL